MASDSIYRVIVRTTGSVQPSGTFWKREPVYCGPSLRDARVAYLREEVNDRGGSYGNPARETIIERFEADSEDIEDVKAEEIDI